MAEEEVRDSRLTEYEDIKDVVVANAVKNVPVLKKAKNKDANTSLSQF